MVWICSNHLLSISVMRDIIQKFGFPLFLISCTIIVLQLDAPRAFALGPYATTVATDGHDANTADGICEVTVGLADCTLRAAIEQANADAVTTMVNVTNFTGLNYVVPLGELPITGDIALVGATYATDIGATALGNRAFHVLPGGKLSMTLLRVASMTASVDGACIYNEGRLELTNVELLSCVSSGVGGALAATPTSSTLIQGPNGTGGGGSLFVESSATYGGCVHNKSTDFVVRGLRFLSCTASLDGGAFYNDVGANASFEDYPGSPSSSYPTFSGSVASRNGGAIFNNGDLVLKNAMIRDGKAVDGAGIYNNGTLNSYVTTIRGNYASGNGGGLYSSSFASLVRGSIYSNTAVGDGGGVYHIAASLILTSYTVANNTSNASGGGLYTQNNGLDVRLTSVWDNSSTVNLGHQLFIQAPTQIIAKSSILSSADAILAGAKTDCYGGGELILQDVNLVHLDSLSNCIYSGAGQTGGTPLLTTYPLVATPAIDDLNNVVGPYLNVVADIPTSGGSCAGAITDQIGNLRRTPRCTIGALENSTVVYVGKISGRVTRQRDGAPLSNICVTAGTLTGNQYSGTTDGSGYYEIGELQDDQYIVSFSDCHDNFYAQEWYNESATSTGSSRVAIASQNSVSNIDGTLVAGGRVTGHVYDEITGLPINNMNVIALLYDPVVGLTSIAEAFTNSAGFYSLTGVSEGDIYIAFVDPDNVANGGQYYPEWADNVAIGLVSTTPNPITDGASKMRIIFQPAKGDSYSSNDVLDAYLGLAPPVPGGGRMDVSVIKTGIGLPQIGQTYSYTLKIKNKINLEAKGVYVEENIPIGTSYVSSSVNCVGAPLRCSVPDLLGYAEYIFTITVRIDAPGSLNNVAVAKSTRSIDTYPADNTAQFMLSVSDIPREPGSSVPMSQQLAKTGTTVVSNEIVSCFLLLSVVSVGLLRRKANA
jgi:uncharacterized repeat protein (TIGR01451 family)